MQVRAVDLPELRAELATALAQPDWTFFYEDRRAALARRGAPSTTTDELQRMEVGALLLGDLFYVTEEMYELAKAAAKTLPPFTLQPEDVPSEFGFAYLAPGNHAPPGSLNSVAAVEWWPTGVGVRLNFYCETEQMLASMATLGKATPEQINRHRRSTGRLSPMLSEAIVRFGHDPLEGADEGDEEFVRTIRAMWLLMQQPLARQADIPPDRATRKRLARSGHEPAPVRLIGLRRPQGGGSSGSGDREYHHQWIVRGHWRQQWHPKRQVHRPVWIAPHVKGPEGAPLIGGEKVNVLKR